MNLRMALLLPVFLAAGAQALGQTPASSPVEAAVPPTGSSVLPAPGLAPAGPPIEGLNGEPAAANGDVTHLWGEVEYLLFWLKGDAVPPLVTTSPVGTSQALAGVLGHPKTTTTLFGESGFNSDGRSGARLTLGYWFDDQHNIGIEASYFLLESQGTDFGANSGTTPILARPFLSTSLVSSASLVAFPGVATGSIIASEHSSVFHGGELLLRQSLTSDVARVDVVWGYRYLHLGDELDVGESVLRGGGATTSVPLNALPKGFTLSATDLFRTVNDLNALEVGLDGEIRRGNFVASGFAKVAAAQSLESLDIFGITSIRAPNGANLSRVGGVLALPTNIGRSDKLEYPAVLDVGGQLGYQFGPQLRVFVGYELLYLSRVLRAGEEVNTLINPTRLPFPGTVTTLPAEPSRLYNFTDFWAQGLNVGVEFKY